MLCNVTTVGAGLGGYGYKLLGWGLGEWYVEVVVVEGGGGVGYSGKEWLGLIGGERSEIMIAVSFEGRVYRRKFIFRVSRVMVDVVVRVTDIVYRVRDKIKGIIKVFRKG